MLPATLLPALLLLAGMPSLRDHFPQTASPTHDFLLLDADAGEVLRQEGAGADSTVTRPWGSFDRVVRAFAGIEDASLDPDARATCDSTCWARGAHGDVGLVEALAWGCDTWWARYGGRVSAAAAEAHARTAGLSLPGGDSERSSLGAGVAFFRHLLRDDAHWKAETSTRLLAAAGMAVSSPRGTARALHDPRRRTRALTGSDEHGAWVVGSREVLGHTWIFALYLPGGSTALATARAAQLLEETRRVARASSAQRGGMPTNEPR